MGAYLSSTPPGGDDTTSIHYPSERDVLAVRTMLLHYLPLELADIILDLAVYWTRIVIHSTQPFVASASSRPGIDANFVYLVTPPIPYLQHTEGADSCDQPTKVRMMRFSISSHDQGWGGEQNLQGSSRMVTYIDFGFLMSPSGPYQGSYTWFEACIYRSVADYPGVSEEAKARVTGGMVWKSQDELESAGVTQVANPLNGKQTWLIQRNVRASSDIAQHTITWIAIDACGDGEEDFNMGCGRGAGFVRSLIAGDRVAIMARALVSI